MYKLSMSPSLYQSLGLELSQYLNKEDAIDAVSKALVSVKIEYSVVENEEIVRFVNSSGGELASIIN